MQHFAFECGFYFKFDKYLKLNFLTALMHHRNIYCHFDVSIQHFFMEHFKICMRIHEWKLNYLGLYLIHLYLTPAWKLTWKKDNEVQIAKKRHGNYTEHHNGFDIFVRRHFTETNIQRKIAEEFICQRDKIYFCMISSLLTSFLYSSTTGSWGKTWIL